MYKNESQKLNVDLLNFMMLIIFLKGWVCPAEDEEYAIGRTNFVPKMHSGLDNPPNIVDTTFKDKFCMPYIT